MQKFKYLYQDAIKYYPENNEQYSAFSILARYLFLLLFRNSP